MNLWQTIKRVNQRYDACSRRTLERMIASVDHPERRHAMRHLNIRDLLAKGLNAGKKAE